VTKCCAGTVLDESGLPRAPGVRLLAFPSLSLRVAFGGLRARLSALLPGRGG